MRVCEEIKNVTPSILAKKSKRLTGHEELKKKKKKDLDIPPFELQLLGQLREGRQWEQDVELGAGFDGCKSSPLSFCIGRAHRQFR